MSLFFWSKQVHLVINHLDRQHVEVDLILPERGHPLALEAIVREPRQLESAQHLRLDEACEK